LIGYKDSHQQLWKCYKTITWLLGFLCQLTNEWWVGCNSSMICCRLWMMNLSLMFFLSWAWNSTTELSNLSAWMMIMNICSCYGNVGFFISCLLSKQPLVSMLHPSYVLIEPNNLDFFNSINIWFWPILMT
jgi:hypothetical protein